MDRHLNIVCYTGGTCGDLVTALIDSKNVQFRAQTVCHDSLRIKLKKPHLFADDAEKDQYLLDIAEHYTSIPSHDLEYHKRKNHRFVAVTVSDYKFALKAAKRFKSLHRPHVWDEMSKFCGANTTEEYAQRLIDYSNMVSNYTDQIITFESIRQGTAIHDLEKLLGIDIDRPRQNLYKNWLNLQKDYYPGI